MYQSDYILRLIEQMGTLLRRVLSALREHRPDEVLELTDGALETALGMSSAAHGSLTGEALVAVLGGGGNVDPGLALVVGEALLRRGQAHTLLGQEPSARHELERAEAVLLVATGEEAAGRARELLGELAQLRDGAGYDR